MTNPLAFRKSRRFVREKHGGGVQRRSLDEIPLERIASQELFDLAPQEMLSDALPIEKLRSIGRLKLNRRLE
jgi:hypothetical protein